MDNKITNIVGVPIPQWLVEQFKVRSEKGASYSQRDANELQFLSNKTAWVRMVSSIEVSGDDNRYFSKYLKDEKLIRYNVEQSSETFSTSVNSLAKNFILFSGTSRYSKEKNASQYSMNVRSGISDGSYGMLGEEEINRYGYLPMPGITSVTIETAGRMGSVRYATINFKVFNKLQLDIIDALYFKMGYTMLLEWGHTYYYKTKGDGTTVYKSTEELMIDPFGKEMDKEKINYQIAYNSRESHGNYDGMLGMVTNFNFSRKEDTTYDCSVRIIALGAIAESLNINRSEVFTDILKEQVKILVNAENVEIKKQAEKEQEEILKKYQDDIRSLDEDLQKIPTLDDYFRDKIKNSGITNVSLPNFIYLNSNGENDIVYHDPKNSTEWGIRKFGIILKNEQPIQQVTLSNSEISKKLQFGKSKYYDKAEGRNKEKPVTDAESFSNLDPIDYNEGVEYHTFPVKYTVFSKASVTLPDNTVKEQNVPRNYYFIIKINTKYLNFKRRNIVADAQTGNIRDVGNNVIFKDEASSKKIKKVIFDYFLKSSLKTDNAEGIKFVIESARVDTTDLTKTIDATYGVGLYGKASSNAIVYTPTIKINVRLIFPKDGENSIPEFRDGTRQIDFSLTISDSALIQEIQVNSEQQNIREFKLKEQETQRKEREDQLLSEKQKIQERYPTISITDAQKEEAAKFQSAIEQALRTIQVYSLNKSGQSNTSVEEVSFLSKENEKLAKALFSEVGLFSSVYPKIVNDSLSDISNYGAISSTDNITTGALLEFYTKYGFNCSVISNNHTTATSDNKLDSLLVPIEKDVKVDYNDLLKSYVIPYQVSQEFSQGLILERPVYIKLGTLIFLINHLSLLYTSKEKESNEKLPIFYFDYNPNTNFCLTCLNHLSTNPLNFLIPYSGDQQEFKKLFESSIIGEIQSELFNPSEDNIISSQIPDFIEDGARGKSVYRGKIMNTLIDIDYLLNTIKRYSTNDSTNSTYFKSFIENILSDMCKALGNFNMLRLAYNDAGNCFYIVDDQLIPTVEPEKSIYRSNSSRNNYEIPLYGNTSIAKTVEIKTDVSTRLAKMIAISANSEDYQAESGVDSTPIGYINKNFRDRYLALRGDIVSENAKTKKKDQSKKTVGDTDAAKKFNQAIKYFYGFVNIPLDYVNGATTYYISRLSKVKAENPATRASAIIPVSVNFTTDGISGFHMYQAFTINEELLPYTYTAKNNTENVAEDQKVGFCVMGLTHTIQNNQWNTSVRAGMVYLRNEIDFTGQKNEKLPTSKESVTVSAPSYEVTGVNTKEVFSGNLPAWSAAFISYVMKKAGIDFTPDASHTRYLNSLRNNPYFQLLDPSKTPLKVGDIIVANRTVNGIKNNQRYTSNPYSGFSHGDIVVSINSNSAQVIGGNVSDTVSKKSISLSNGIVVNADVFVVARPNKKINEIVSVAQEEYNLWNSNKWKESNPLARTTLKRYYSVVGINIA